MKYINVDKKYKKGDKLYSIKTGKYYGEVHLSQIGERGAEHVFIIKNDGTGFARTRKQLEKIAKKGGD